MTAAGPVSPRPDRVETFADLRGELERLRVQAAVGRGKLKLSLHDLAGASGLPRSSLARYLSDGGEIPAEQLRTLVLALGVPGDQARAWSAAWERAVEHKIASSRPPAAAAAPPPAASPPAAVLAGATECGDEDRSCAGGRDAAAAEDPRDPTGPAGPPGTDPAVPPALSRRGRKPLAVLGAAGLLVLGAAAAASYLPRTGQADPSGGPGSAGPSPLPSAQLSGLGSPQAAELPSAPRPAAHTAPVDGRLTDRTARTISLWTQPSTDSGCDRDPCWPGTRTSGVVRPEQPLAVSCTVDGQRVQNGVRGEPGFYEDDRWLLVAEGQAFGQRPGEAVYISNIFYAREALPANVPSCSS